MAAPTALIILAEGFEEIEAVAPIDILRRAGVEVTVAGLSGTSVKSARGVSVTADRPLDRGNSNFDAIVLPGGGIGAKNLAASEAVKSLVQEFHRQGKWVCAICASPALVLGPAGVLKGKSATCFKGMESGFGPEVRYLNQKVVSDGNVLTSQGPGTAVEFALSIVEKLAGPEKSAKIRSDLLA